MKDTSSGGKLNLLPMEKVIAEEKPAVWLVSQNNRTVESLGWFSSHEVSYQWEKWKKAFKKNVK